MSDALTFRFGDRVRLTGTHPWSGSSGEIVDLWRGSAMLGLDWEIRLDNGDYPGHTVAASESQMQPAVGRGFGA